MPEPSRVKGLPVPVLRWSDLRRRDLIGAAVVAVVGCALVVGQTFSMSLGAMRPGTLLRSGLASVDVRQYLARERVEKGDLASLNAGRKLAIDAYRQSPVALPALDTILLADTALGRSGEVNAILDSAQRLAVRQPTFNLLRLRRAATRGDPEEMALDADYLLRTDRRGGAQILPGLIAESDHPAFAAALAARLATRPQWRAAYLQAAGLSVDHRAGTLAVLRALHASGSGPASSEVAPYFAIGGRDLPVAQLRAQWLELDPAADHAAAREAIYDGGFAMLGGSTPFNWAFNSAAFDFDQTQDNAGQRGLTIRPRRPSPERVASQVLLLAPGRHMFDLVAGLDAGASSGDRDVPTVRVTVTCLGTNRVVGRIGLALGTAMRGYAFPLFVPADCAGQTLAIDSDPTPASSPAAFRLADFRID